MLKVFLFAILPCILLAQVPVPENKTEGSKEQSLKPFDPPRLEILPTKPISLGSTGPKEIKIAEFKVKNTSPTPISLKMVSEAPGTQLDPLTLVDPLEPGQSRVLRVSFDPKEFVGYVRRVVRLGTDDPRQGHYYLRLDADVRPEIQLDQPRQSLGEVRFHERPSTVFVLKREGGEPLEIQVEGQVPTYLDVKVDNQLAKFRSEIQVVLDPKKLKPGTTGGLDVIKVKTNGARQPEFTLYLDYSLKPPLNIRPSRLVFEKPETKELQVELQSWNDQAFVIEELRLDGAGFELLDQPKEPTHKGLLRIRRLKDGRAEGQIFIKLKGVEDPIRIPCLALEPSILKPSSEKPEVNSKPGPSSLLSPKAQKKAKDQM